MLTFACLCSPKPPTLNTYKLEVMKQMNYSDVLQLQNMQYTATPSYTDIRAFEDDKPLTKTAENSSLSKLGKSWSDFTKL